MAEWLRKLLMSVTVSWQHGLKPRRQGNASRGMVIPAMPSRATVSLPNHRQAWEDEIGAEHSLAGGGASAQMYTCVH
eukprot:9832327-Lingulodinium_polyedra.AAC.1